MGKRTITVRTQAELDGVIADSAPVIYIESDAGVWLTVRDSVLFSATKK
jgi:hypothetical protein